jgi:CheY-like chemotaxis protein
MTESTAGSTGSNEQEHRRQPTEEEKSAAAGAEDYLGVPISDEELADVWSSQPSDDEKN